MSRLAGRGHHQRRRRPPPADPDAIPVLREAEAGDLSVNELRVFLAEVDEAAEAAGVDPGGLRLWTAVRLSGAVKAICVKIPGRRSC